MLAHHERVDGSGFPFGLSNGSIPLEARILSVADAFEAMVSERPHRPALHPRGRDAGAAPQRRHAVRPEVVDAFIRALAQDRVRA